MVKRAKEYLFSVFSDKKGTSKFVFLSVLGVMLISLIILAHFVFAVSFTATQSPTSVKEDVSYLYNFTIANTNLTANITQVNITAPNGFTIDTTGVTNGTSASADFVVIDATTNRTISFTNSTNQLIINGTSASFWFNATAANPGTYNFTIVALDDAGITVTNFTAQFIVNDTTAPSSIQFVNPVPSTGSNLSQTTIAANVTATDNGTIDTIVIRLFNSTNDQINSSSSSTSPAYINFANLADGVYRINATVNDTFGNSNSTETRTITLDTANPTINFTNPTETSGSIYNRTNIVINVTANDTNLANITIRLYNSTSLVNQTTTTTSPNFVNITNLPDGTYYFNATTVDFAGNANSTATRNVTVDTTPPALTSYIIMFNDGNSTTNSTVYISPGNQDGRRDGIKINLTASELVNFTIDITPGGFSATDANALNTVKPGSCYWNGTAGSTQCTTGSIGEGTYAINITMIDRAGNFVRNATSKVVVDNTNPSITDNSGLSAGYYNSSKLINITVTDANTVNATLYVNNTIVNSSAASNNTQLTYLLVGDGNYTYYVTATDAGFNTNTSSNVSSIIVDMTNPLINFTSPTSSTGVNLSQSFLYVNISLTEANFANVTYLLYNSSGLVNGTTFTSATTSINWTNLASADYTYQVNVTDLANNKNATEVRAVRLDTTAPSATLLFPANNTFNSTTSQNFTVNITDNLGVKNATLFIFNSTNGVVNQTSLSFGGGVVQTVGIVVNLIDGVYKWLYNVFDWAGNSYTSQNNTLTIDTIKPNIVIAYPANTSYNTTQTAMNYTANDTNLQSCWYSTNSGATNTSVTCGTNVTGLNSGQGSSTWRVYANDSAGNSNYTSSVTFFVDSILPTVQFVSPTDANNSYVSRNNIPINVTANDTNLAIITLGLYNSTGSQINATSSATSPLFINFTNLADGIYYFGASARDILNNTNDTEIRTVTLDTTNPGVNFTAPTQTNGASVSANFIFINVSVNETNEANITFRLFNSSGLMNSTTFAAGNRTINFTRLTVGTYSYNVTLTDKANNQNTTEIRNISLIDAVAPNGTLISPANGTYTNSPQNYTVNATDDLGIKNATLFIYNSTSLVNQTSVSFGGGIVQSTVGVVVSLVDGVYTWFYKVFDFGGNSFTTNNNTITADATLSAVQYGVLTESNGAIYSRTNIVINVTASDTNFANVTVRLFNSAGLVSQTTTATSPNFVNITGLADGVYTFNATAIDLAGNSNSTATRTVTVDTIPPSISFVSPQNTSYYNLSQLINISSNGNTVWFFNGTGNETYTGSVYRTFPEGSNTITAYATDLAGNLNSTQVTFFIIFAPTVTLNSPANGFANPSSSIALNCSAADNLEVKNISLYVNGVLNRTQVGTGTAALEMITTLTGLADGTYSWYCKADDNRTTTGTSATRTFTIDTVNPLIVINSPTLNATYNSNTFSINITSNEAGYCNYSIDNGVTNYTTTNVTSTMFIGTSKILTNGLYSFKAYCGDLAGNRNYTANVSSFTISAPTSSGGGSSGGGGGGSSGNQNTNAGGESVGQTVHADSQSVDSGFSATLGAGDRVEFSLNGETHTLTVNKINGQTATITIRSDPMQLSITFGESKKVDLDNDKVYDLQVTFVSLSDGKAEISIKKISENVPELLRSSAITGSATEEDVSTNSADVIIYVIAGTLLITTILFTIVIGLLISRRNRRMRMHQRPKLPRAVVEEINSTQKKKSKNVR